MKVILQKAKKISNSLPLKKFNFDKSMSLSFGNSKQKKVGQGEEFWDFRKYQVGDPLSKIDWKKSAKIDHLLIKNNENERSRRIWFWRNPNISMNFKNNNKLETKSERSLIIGLILIDIFLRGGESIGLIGSNINVKKGRENFTTLANEFVNKKFKLLDSRIKKGDFLFILSDFLEKPKSLFKVLMNISNVYYDTILIQVLDPSEINFPFYGRNQFYDPNSGIHKIFNKSEIFKEIYKKKFATHQNEIDKICNKIGWKIIRSITNQSYRSVLSKVYNYF